MRTVRLAAKAKTGIFQILIKTQKHKGEEGFSLLEVIASLGVLSMMLLIVYEISIGGMKRAEEARDDLLSLALAQSLMDEKIALNNWNEGAETGDIKGFSWTREVSDYEEDERNLEAKALVLRKLSVTVGKRIELSTLRLVKVER